MGTTKTEVFTEQQNQIAEIFKALGHPARIAIIQTLAKMNACVTGTLVNELPLAQATISQHLKALKEVGLIKGTTEGTSVCYCLNSDVWSTIKPLLTDFLDTNSKKLNCC